MQLIDLKKEVTNSSSIKQSLARPMFDTSLLQQKVKTILDDVKQKGNEAIKKYTQQFDGVSVNDFVVTNNEILEATTLLPEDLKTAIQTAASKA